jgi:predicted RNase H-like nuclease (RuvC/YqgF family)
MKRYVMAMAMVMVGQGLADEVGPATTTAPATTRAVLSVEEALREEVEQLKGEVERLRRENQALQETVDGLRTNSGPAWVSREKYAALELELENERKQVAVLKAEVEELRKRPPATQPVEPVQ